MSKMMLVMMAAAICRADVVIEDGIKLRVKLEQSLSSARAVKGEVIEFSAAADVQSGGITVITRGARVVGTVTQATPKQRLGRAGMLDVSIDKVHAVDGRYINLRSAPVRVGGRSFVGRNAALLAGVSVVAPMLAPVVLLMTGTDAGLARGEAFEAVTGAR